MQTYLSIMAKIPVIYLLILSGSGVIVGDIAAKYWSTNLQTAYFMIAIVGYFASGFFYIPVLLREGLVVTSVIWSLISMLGFVFIGLVMFKESLTAIQSIGVAFGVISMIILVTTMK